MHRILGTPGSPFVRKVRAAFAEKGVACELRPVDVFNPPEGFERLSPLRRIPVLEFGDGREPLADSSAICAYLEALQPEPPLYPRDPHATGRAVWIEEYADTVVAYQLGMGVMRPMLAARAPGEPRDDAKIEEAVTKRLAPLLGYLEGALGEHDWFAGGVFSIADLAVAAQLSGLVLVDRLDILDGYPGLAGLLQRCLQRPSLAWAVADIEPEILEIADRVIDYGVLKYKPYGLSSTLLDVEQMTIYRKGVAFESIAWILKKHFGIAVA